MMNFRRVAAGSLHILKREIKSAMRPTLFQTGVPKPSDSVVGRLQWTTRATFSTESGGTATSDRDKDVVFTKDEIVGWVNRLHKEGKHGHALKIFDFAHEKKIEFSPSDLALYVEILAKVEGVAVAKAYFRKVDPDFNDNDLHAKNWPAFATLWRLTWEGYRKAGLNPLTYYIPPSKSK